MSLMLFYTLCCLACTSVNDLLFKFFARKERSRGLFVTSVGVMGTILMLMLPDKTGENFQITLLWGVICGIFSAVGNILLIESMTTLSAGVCSTIYRLNLALVVPCSVFLLNEKLNWMQYCGVALAILAVIAFLPLEKGDKKERKKLLLPMIMIITASVFRAGLGLSCKYGPIQGASVNGINFIIEIIWIFSGIAYYFIKERQMQFDMKVIKYGAASGILVAGILYFMIKALNVEGANASIVLPIAQMSFLVTFILSVIFLKEKITVPKIIAVICGIGAMLLLT
ncbi:MAG: EamA family transporter [Lentisphaeria bacterium]|nr:EamA family transporter [Lentisphaeria bacterium]